MGIAAGNAVGTAWLSTRWDLSDTEAWKAEQWTRGRVWGIDSYIPCVDFVFGTRLEFSDTGPKHPVVDTLLIQHPGHQRPGP